MLTEKIINWFLPIQVRYNRAHADYHQMYSLVSACLVGTLAMGTIPILLYNFDNNSNLWTYYLNVTTTFITLISLRLTGHWRLPNYISAAIAYFIIFSWLRHNGLIYSSNMGMLHIYLICALLADKKFGWIAILTNLIFLVYVYHLTISSPVVLQVSKPLGSPVYALLLHSVIIIFMGSFLAYGLRKQEMNRIRIKTLQEKQINLLDEVVRERTNQLTHMRQTIATDFHDHTGNMLAAINRQAVMLELKLHDNPELIVFVRSIIENSNELYACSKDFLWTLNHDSDDPATLFQYLVSYGQNFYNQFDISFSADTIGQSIAPGQLPPFAALNIIYIFKEAMTNVIKHSGAEEAFLTMEFEHNIVYFKLFDNGKWKQASEDIAHYGLNNMKNRANLLASEYLINTNDIGTTISVGLKLSSYLIPNEESAII